jgi:UDP-N-acetylmuramoyl-tripeptide--D-alanyl-D-alanine ligase
VSAVLTAAAIALGGLAWVLLLSRIVLVAARMYQIEEYEAGRLFAWGARRSWLLHRSILVATVPVTVAATICIAAPGVAERRAILGAAWLAGALAAQLTWSWLPPKKELVYTPRLRRMLATCAVIAVLLAGAVCFAAQLAAVAVGAVLITAATLGLGYLGMALLVAANTVNAPLEARIRRGFLRRARARMEKVDPLVIAVAGSYGKTSTKHILAHLLERYGPTLATPKSFNTLLGVSRTVNDLLLDSHRTFIVEMDAYAPGEIAAICALVRPRHAVLTSVGPQHLERFGTVERIATALYETLDALPAGGFAIVHGGDAATDALATRARGEGRDVTRYGIADEADGLDVVATDVRISGRGSEFTWSVPSAGLRHRVSVPLLGRHQVLNVSAALATVHRLGLPLQPALDALTSLQPVEHRLQPVPTANAITVIDDSYNANPVGVHNGLEVLAEVEARWRILVTPGLVELGSVEDAENRRYGEHAARVCDHVIVMDARPGRALREGLRAGGLADERIHVVHTLAEATAVIGRIARAGDAVLFANDLPDTYLGAA